LPGIIRLLALSYVYVIWGQLPVINALLFGLKAAVLAIVVEALIRIGKRALKSRGLVALAAGAFVGIFFFAVPFPIIILVAALLGFTGYLSSGLTPSGKIGKSPHESILCAGGRQ